MPPVPALEEHPAPLVYRSMFEEEGKPQVGQRSSTLGVLPDIDITAQSDGTVQPNTGRMSVAPSLLKLPYSMIPKRLKHLLPNGEGAKGGNNLRVWKRGTGAFADAPLAPKLALRVDSPKHGLVEPDAVMPFAEYEAALQNTRNDWEDGE